MSLKLPIISGLTLLTGIAPIAYSCCVVKKEVKKTIATSNVPEWQQWKVTLDF